MMISSAFESLSEENNWAIFKETYILIGEYEKAALLNDVAFSFLSFILVYKLHHLLL